MVQHGDKRAVLKCGIRAVSSAIAFCPKSNELRTVYLFFQLRGVSWIRQYETQFWFEWPTRRGAQHSIVLPGTEVQHPKMTCMYHRLITTNRTRISLHVNSNETLLNGDSSCVLLRIIVWWNISMTNMNLLEICGPCNMANIDFNTTTAFWNYSLFCFNCFNGFHSQGNLLNTF